LSELAAAAKNGDNDIMNHFGLFGIIKEVGVDDEGLLEFHKYFNHPLYLDPSNQFYKALGSRSILTVRTWNPLRWYRAFKSMNERIARKNLTGNYVGEGLIQGGVIIFDRSGTPRAVYQELTGQELPMDDIIAALTVLQAEVAAEEATTSSSNAEEADGADDETAPEEEVVAESS